MSRVLRRRVAGLAVVLAALVTLTTGCGFHGLYSASLPGSVGGPFSGAKTYTISVYFDDVLDLVPQSAVKVNDVIVGSVTAVDLVPDHGVYRAKVVCKVEDSVNLPANTTAVLEETSLLGEKYVELVNPATGGTGSLKTTRNIGPVPSEPLTAQSAAASSAYPAVEEVFGVLSTVLNGGGLQNLQTINTELSAALAGREDKVHDVISQLDTFVGGLNGVRTQINGAIDAVDTLSTTLNKQDATIATALDDLGPGFKVLADERANLVTLLQGLSSLGVVANRVINASLSSTKADLADLEPILTQLNKAGSALPGALEEALDYPFPSTAPEGIKGDGNNLTLNVDLAGTLKSLCGTTTAGTPLATACSTLITTLTGLIPTLGSGITGLLGGLHRSPAVKAGGASLSQLLSQGAS